MTPSPMPPFVPKLLAAGIMTASMLGIAAAWSSHRNDGTDLQAVDEFVRVVPGGSDTLDHKAGGPSALPMASRRNDPAAVLQTIVASSFPKLSNFEAKCVEQACEIKATTNAPEGGQDLADYENMIRFDIPAILRQRDHALTEPPQIEDVADGSVQIILHASGGR